MVFAKLLSTIVDAPEILYNAPPLSAPRPVSFVKVKFAAATSAESASFHLTDINNCESGAVLNKLVQPAGVAHVEPADPVEE